jgi:L-lactate utilization protein LutB
VRLLGKRKNPRFVDLGFEVAMVADSPGHPVAAAIAMARTKIAALFVMETVTCVWESTYYIP